MNKLLIIGNLTRDPELRATREGKEVCSFTVAVNSRRRDAQGDIVPDFFRVSAWEGLGRNCKQYLSKGKKVAVIGSVTVSVFQGNDGEARAQMEVFAQDVEFLTPKDAKPEQKPGIDKASGMEKAELPEGVFDELPF